MRGCVRGCGRAAVVERAAPSPTRRRASRVPSGPEEGAEAERATASIAALQAAALPPPPPPKSLYPCRWLDRPPPPYPTRRKKPSLTARSRRRRPTLSPPTPRRHGSRRRRHHRPSRRLRLRPPFRPSPPPRAPGRQACRHPRPAPAPFRPAAPEGRSQPLDGQLLRGAQEVHREVQHGCEGG